MTQNQNIKVLNETITECRLCPRLVEYRENLPKRLAFADQEYWRRPLPGFGDPHAQILLTGLAPSAHGGNRTGRIFTGDESGKFLFGALFKAGFANQPLSIAQNDGLKLRDVYITAAVKCAPPQNKPTQQEFATCQRYYRQEIELLKNVKVVLALGKLAFEAYLNYVKSTGVHFDRALKFSHGNFYKISEGLPLVYTSYHPSPQNTYTGILTEQMFLDLLDQIKIQLAIG